MFVSPSHTECSSHQPGERSGLSRWGAVVLGVILLAGCQPEAQITQYEIPKPEAIQLPFEGGAAPATGSPAGRPERMLGAIAAQTESLWFFKLTGPIDAVPAAVEPFQAFLKSLKFVDGKPEWTLPAGWERQAGSGMRFATIRVPAEPPLELTVISLPNVGGDLPPQILANVNRWRGQLSLPPLELAQLEAETTTVTAADGTLVTVIDASGTSSGGSMMNAPFAQGLNRPAGGLTPDAVPEREAPARLTYDTPAGWKPGRVGGMRKAAFEIVDGDQRAEVTVIDLAADARDRLANVNRWRGQIGLAELTADQLAAELTPIDVGPLKGDYVKLIGDPQATKPQTILGVIVDHDDMVWFLKLQGDSALAAREQANFETFVKSIVFQPTK